MTELALLPTGFGEVPSAIPIIVCVVSDGVRAVGTASKDSAVSSTIAPTPTFGAPLAKQSAVAVLAPRTTAVFHHRVFLSVWGLAGCIAKFEADASRRQ